MDSLTYTQLLRRNRSFRRLWIGQVISELGNWFNFIAALGLVRVVSHADPEVTTILLITRLMPFTLFAPLAGAFVDRWSRRTVMIATDLLRVVVALGFLLVRRPEDLWLAYLCTALLSFFGAFFEAAKNAAVPNITGERDLLAGNALMFSSRFLLMSVGAALGGWTAAHVGYQAAFIINALSFFASAYSVWLVPEEDTRSKSNGEITHAPRSLYRGYWSDMREGWTYIVTHAPVATILGINILWATGGGANNLIADRLGALVFAGENGISPDSAVAAFYFAGGFGLFIGMMIARRVGAFFELRKRTVAFIGWSLFIQGVFYAFAGVMPTLVWSCVMIAISRVLLGAEFAVQETLLMRLVPDHLRGRVSTSDRAGEMLIWAFSTAAAGWSLHTITPRTLAVITGLLSGTAGLLWLVLFVTRRVRLPKRLAGGRHPEQEQLAGAGD
ncbi:MAG TPA: MFS transporter [Pyrinomonadaceae bacterium]|jgi:MFS family permease|nr:MFS transporter [Pyrinomonadaceae bacterium]